MFYYASAFDQDLGWCVDDGVGLDYAFSGSLCESTSCGVTQADGACPPSRAPTLSVAPTATPAPTVPLDDTSLRTAVAAWLSDRAAAEATYGHISRWGTRGVTDMSYLFCGASGWSSCNTAAASFNEDIGDWDTSGVTRMDYMFYYASAFSRNIGDWAVDSVTTMYYMFSGASSFNQDIGAWDTSGVTTMEDMFYSASAFTRTSARGTPLA